MSDSHDEWLLLNIGMEPPGLRNILFSYRNWAQSVFTGMYYTHCTNHCGCEMRVGQPCPHFDLSQSKEIRQLSKAPTDWYIAQLGDA